jgi:thioredoxin-related protein
MILIKLYRIMNRFIGLFPVVTLILLMGVGSLIQIQNESFNWLKMEEAQEAAAIDGKHIMVFVEAEWCGICRQMERNVFPDEIIQELIKSNYHPVTIDLDSKEKITFNGREMAEREFARRMNVSATPTILFINPDGEVLAHQIGYNPADRFEALLRFVYSDHFGEIPFEEFFQMWSEG